MKTTADLAPEHGHHGVPVKSMWTVGLIGTVFLDHFLLAFSFLEGLLSTASEARFLALHLAFPTCQFSKLAQVT